MREQIIKLAVIIFLGSAVSGCVTGLKLGTSQKSFQALNPEPDRMALIYI